MKFFMQKKSKIEYKPYMFIYIIVAQCSFLGMFVTSQAGSISKRYSLVTMKKKILVKKTVAQRALNYSALYLKNTFVHKKVL